MKVNIAMDTAKTVGDVTAAGTAVGTVLAWIPPIAAIFTVLWTTMRMYEMIRGEKFSQTPIGKQIRKHLKMEEKEEVEND